MFSKISFRILSFFLLLILPIYLFGQISNNNDLKQNTEEWFENNPDSYPHWLTPEEKTFQYNNSREFYETDPPVGPIINIPEFGPMEGVLIRYPFGISYSIIAEMSEDIIVTTIVSSTGQQNNVTNQYSSNGVNLNNCNFLIAPSNSYWTRDYGPWYIIDGNQDLAIVNFPYNRPRPYDNDIPIEMADFLGIDLYGMNVITAGGNYMTDGMGNSASSTLVFDENPSQSQNQIRNKIENYLGVPNYHVIDDPNNTYIDHIDCWSKFLDFDKILIRSVPSSHAQYDEIEEVVNYFEEQATAYNTPYEIYRVYTPQNQPYTNSIILNNKVLVPITGSSWDDDAIDIYEEAMPGYEIVGFTGSWESTDALHCRAKGISDREMIFISHIPPSEELDPGTEGVEVNASLVSITGEELSSINAEIIFRYNNDPFQTLPLSWISGNQFIGIIPSCVGGCEVSYYLKVESLETGKIFNHPFIGEPDPHVFNLINEEIDIPVFYSSDWNLVGNPVNTQNNNVIDIFPSATENTLYSFGLTGYVSQSELSPSMGYWLHFQDNGMASISGLPIHQQTLNLMEGWNLISGISVDIPTPQIIDPSDILIPNTFYGYEPGTGYVNSDLIIPGHGYWVRTNSEGIITFNDDLSQTKTIDFYNRTDTADWISINGIKLYLGVSIPTSEKGSYSLPPKPMGNGMDVRFRGDLTYCGNNGIIEIMTENEFLNFEYNISNSEIKWIWTDIFDDKTIILEDSGTLIITNSSLYKIEKQVAIPEEITLHPNFPNPFNPKTRIRIDLIKGSNISLDIFNISGQHMINLIKGMTNAGTYELEWDGNNTEGSILPAGIYFYTLTFDNKILSHKMVFLK